ncbi:MAG: LysR substrate-binding domain-containing protein [Casimicrobium sp.]|jgi:LysR family glycine cleavage system transcriptional activator
MQNPNLAPRSRPLTLAGLRGFEAAARLASLTAAANALSLTQSAVSRQVQGLEDELGVSLFVRKAREIALTPAGREFLPLVQRVLHDLDNGVERLRRDVNSPRVSVTTFASFASLWLIPRLQGFRNLRPTADLDIGATDRMFDLDTEDVDVAIRYMRAEAAPPDATILIEEVLFPLVSPTYLKTAPRLKQLDDLKLHTLIESTAGGPAEVRSTWPSFFEAVGQPEVKGRSQLKFDFIMQTFLAAQGGQGVVLGRTYGADVFMAGDLIRPIEVSAATGGGSYLIVSERAKSRSEVRAFVEWLLAEAKKFNAELDAWMKRSGVVPAKRQTRKT